MFGKGVRRDEVGFDRSHLPSQLAGIRERRLGKKSSRSNKVWYQQADFALVLMCQHRLRRAEKRISLKETSSDLPTADNLGAFEVGSVGLLFGRRQPWQAEVIYPQSSCLCES
jgi:hypothetical protein